MPDNYCGVKLNVAGFEKENAPAFRAIILLRIVECGTRIEKSQIPNPKSQIETRHRKVEKGNESRFCKKIIPVKF